MQFHSHNFFPFSSNTLCVPEVITLINTRMLFWACSTNKPEGYRGECALPEERAKCSLTNFCPKHTVGFLCKQKDFRIAWGNVCWCPHDYLKGPVWIPGCCGLTSARNKAPCSCSLTPPPSHWDGRDNQEKK